MTDRELVEWVARAQIGQALPPEYRNGRMLINRLVEIGVMHEPEQGAAMDKIYADAQGQARAWLQQHPA